MKKILLHYFENNLTALFCRKFDEIFRIYSKFYLKCLLPIPVVPIKNAIIYEFGKYKSEY